MPTFRFHLPPPFETPMLAWYRLQPGEPPRYRGREGDAYPGSDAAPEILRITRLDGKPITPEEFRTINTML